MVGGRGSINSAFKCHVLVIADLCLGMIERLGLRDCGDPWLFMSDQWVNYVMRGARVLKWPVKIMTRWLSVCFCFIQRWCFMVKFWIVLHK